jgi:hypothetical protein
MTSRDAADIIGDGELQFVGEYENFCWMKVEGGFNGNILMIR